MVAFCDLKQYENLSQLAEKNLAESAKMQSKHFGNLLLFAGVQSRNCAVFLLKFCYFRKKFSSAVFFGRIESTAPFEGCVLVSACVGLSPLREW